MKSDKEKSKILHMGRIKMFIATTGNQVAEQDLCRKARWTLSLTGAKTVNKARSIFIYSRRNMEETAGVIFLRNAGEVTPGTQCSALVLSNSRSM